MLCTDMCIHRYLHNTYSSLHVLQCLLIHIQMPSFFCREGAFKKYCDEQAGLEKCMDAILDAKGVEERKVSSAELARSGGGLVWKLLGIFSIFTAAQSSHFW